MTPEHWPSCPSYAIQTNTPTSEMTEACHSVYHLRYSYGLARFGDSKASFVVQRNVNGRALDERFFSFM